MNKLITFLILCFLIIGTSWAQDDFKFGKPPKELLTQTAHALEPDTDAAIVYKRNRIFFEYQKNKGFVLKKEIELRLKVYSKEGTGWGTFEIPLIVSANDEEKVSGIKGYTFNVVDGKITDEKLKKEGIFEEEMNRYRNKTSITMPSVKEGSVIDLTYTIYSPFLSNVGEVMFQYAIPVDEVYTKVDIPEYYVFKTYSKGFFPINYEESLENLTINFTSKNRRRNDLTSQTSFSNENVTIKENVYSISAKNIPSLKEELYTNNIDNYRTAIIFELSSIQWPGEPYKNMAQTWDDVTKSIYQIDDFGNELNKTRYFEQDIDALIGTTTDEAKKAALIFNYIKSKMIWNDYYGFTTDDGVKKAYEENTGNVAEINLMLTAMLRYAGINANPVLVSTRSNGIPLYPTRNGFNYVIAAIEVENAVILLDATDKNSSPNILPAHVLNWNGRLIREDGSSSVINLIPSKKSNEFYNMSVKLSENGDAEGRIRMFCTEHIALDYRQNIKPLVKEQYLERLENAYNGIEISNYEVKNTDDISKPIIETYGFYAENVFEVVGDKLYISPLLFMAETENPFKAEKREYPVDFTYPRMEKYMFNIQLPEGYKIESLPENAAVQLPDNLGIFKYKITSNTISVQVLASVEINSAILPAAYYDILKEYFKQIIDKEAEKIVLSKA
ncbi:transglutaminase domain-containing protein [Ascidiimonas sp. W6]|uniref:transglutaminase domain-containing protein n=1 Tax=Ascidiimonas meishanensis TaxID=3128903 RepID=UPI0030EE5213